MSSCDGPSATTSGGSSGRARCSAGALDQAGRAAPTRATVTILGETGTGKELVARAIHDASDRAAGPFVAVNCAAIPEALLEAELFGYAKGAFTGAVTARKGKFELAHGGTLLLDEIGDLALTLQAKILRVLERGEIQPLGSEESRQVDVRIVTATNRDLQERVAAGQFRQDLYWRVNVITLELPPLRAAARRPARADPTLPRPRGRGDRARSAVPRARRGDRADRL